MCRVVLSDELNVYNYVDLCLGGTETVDIYTASVPKHNTAGTCIAMYIV